MDISCALATASDTPAQVQLAETLGYQRAWLYDSPALVTDVWMVLSRCAERTTRLGLGPGVLVPSLRHPLVNAAAIAELVDQAPGRVVVGIGSGFTDRLALGKRPMSWSPHHRSPSRASICRAPSWADSTSPAGRATSTRAPGLHRASSTRAPGAIPGTPTMVRVCRVGSTQTVRGCWAARATRTTAA